jgi:hypothetical protein
VLAGGSRDVFVPNTPNRLRAARTCYDHLAGTLGISLHDRFTGLRWLKGGSRADNTYNLTPAGEKGFAALGDRSERRPQVGGALAAAFHDVALKRKWVVPDLDSRAVSITNTGRRDMLARFGLEY